MCSATGTVLLKFQKSSKKACRTTWMLSEANKGTQVTPRPFGTRQKITKIFWNSNKNMMTWKLFSKMLLSHYEFDRLGSCLILIRQQPDQSGCHLILIWHVPDQSGSCMILIRQQPDRSGCCLIFIWQVPDQSGSCLILIRQQPDQ